MFTNHKRIFGKEEDWEIKAGTLIPNVKDILGELKMDMMKTFRTHISTGIFVMFFLFLLPYCIRTKQDG